MTPSATAGIAIALITGLAAVIKKIIGRKVPPKPDLITRVEFHAALDHLRERIDATLFALVDKLEQQHSNVLTTLERQGANFEHRLDSLESNLARLDERTLRSSSSMPRRAVAPSGGRSSSS